MVLGGKLVREIKFRGLESMTGDWVYGNLVQTGVGMRYIIPRNLIGDVIPQWLVDRDTVGQYTGLKDKNGKEIYEGDIVEFTWFDYVGSDTQFKGLVKYRSGLYEIWKNDKTEFFGSDGAFILNHVWLQDEEFEVIGNIYENPELLKGGETACK
jgi:uncharacterized phage protein (TIGR01671 family)